MGTRNTYFGSRDSELLSFSANFSRLINESPETYGITAERAAAYATLHDDYASKLAACDPNSRSKVSVSAKNAARDALKEETRMIVNLINGTASVTDGQKIELGLTVRAKSRRRIDRPDAAPGVQVVSVSGCTAQVKLYDTTGSSRGRPRDAKGAIVFTHVGDEPPTDMSQWRFHGTFGRTKCEVAFPPDLRPGAKVWFSATWFNNRKQHGPASAPVSCHLPGGGVSAAAAARLAA